MSSPRNTILDALAYAMDMGFWYDIPEPSYDECVEWFYDTIEGSVSDVDDEAGGLDEEIIDYKTIDYLRDLLNGSNT